MDTHTHWEKIYREKAPDDVSWYREHLETSLQLIELAAPARVASIIDVGGGESTLVDDLLAHGYKDVTVLDVSHTAIDVSKKRFLTAIDERTAYVRQGKWQHMVIVRILNRPKIA
jgi:hypothetical protein